MVVIITRNGENECDISRYLTLTECVGCKQTRICWLDSKFLVQIILFKRKNTLVHQVQQLPMLGRVDLSCFPDKTVVEIWSHTPGTRQVLIIISFVVLVQVNFENNSSVQHMAHGARTSVPQTFPPPSAECPFFKRSLDPVSPAPQAEKSQPTAILSFSSNDFHDIN